MNFQIICLLGQNQERKAKTHYMIKVLNLLSGVSLVNPRRPIRKDEF